MNMIAVLGSIAWLGSFAMMTWLGILDTAWGGAFVVGWAFGAASWGLLSSNKWVSW